MYCVFKKDFYICSSINHKFFYLLSKSNIMTTLTNIEVLRMKREAAVTKMDNALKCVNLRKDFFIACKEIRAIDEQIKQTNTSK